MASWASHAAARAACTDAVEAARCRATAGDIWVPALWITAARSGAKVISVRIAATVIISRTAGSRAQIATIPRRRVVWFADERLALDDVIVNLWSTGSVRPKSSAVTVVLARAPQALRVSRADAVGAARDIRTAVRRRRTIGVLGAELGATAIAGGILHAHRIRRAALGTARRRAALAVDTGLASGAARSCADARCLATGSAEACLASGTRAIGIGRAT